MAASASLLGKAGAGSDSKGGGEARRRRTKEIDGNLSYNGINNGNKEEENIKENKVVEDQFESMMKQYDMMIAMLTEMATENDKMDEYRKHQEV